MKTRVFLRHVKTRMFYSGWHNWTSELNQAAEFERPEDAIEKARSEGLGQTEMVIQEGEPVRERVVPIIDPGC